MNWEIIAMLILKEGLPLAQALVAKWASGTPPTAADFEDLQKLAKQTAYDRTIAKLGEMGISPESEEGKRILALVA